MDTRRLYATGHSNGGGFTYLLWSARGETFAAFCSIRSGVRQIVAQAQQSPCSKSGEKLITPGRAREAAADDVESVRWWKLNQCVAQAALEGEGLQRQTPSQLGEPVVTFLIHPGAHVFPGHSPAIVKFFKKQHSQP